MSQNHIGILDSLTLESVDHYIPEFSFEGFGYDLLDIASLEASIKQDIQSLDDSVRMVRAMDAIDPSKLSVESYRAAMYVALHMAGIEDQTSEIVPTFESGTPVEDYTAEAEEKKQGFLSKMWAVIKRIYLAIKTKLVSLLGLNKAKVDKLKAQQTVVEKKAKTAGGKFENFHKPAANEAVKPEPVKADDPNPTPKKEETPAASTRSVQLEFLGHTLHDVVEGAGHVAELTRRFLDEIATAAEKATHLDYKTLRDGTGTKTNFPTLVTHYDESLKLTSGTSIYVGFYYGGPKVEVHGSKKITVETTAADIPLDNLVGARKKLVEAMDYKQTKLGHLQQVYNGLEPVFEKEFAAREELGSKLKTPEWKDTQPHWEKQEHIMRGIESVLGWIKGCIWSPVERVLDPGIAEIDRIVGLRKLDQMLGRDK